MYIVACLLICRITLNQITVVTRIIEESLDQVISGYLPAWLCQYGKVNKKAPLLLTSKKTPIWPHYIKILFQSPTVYSL